MTCVSRRPRIKRDCSGNCPCCVHCAACMPKLLQQHVELPNRTEFSLACMVRILRTGMHLRRHAHAWRHISPRPGLAPASTRPPLILRSMRACTPARLTPRLHLNCPFTSSTKAASVRVTPFPLRHTLRSVSRMWSNSSLT